MATLHIVRQSAFISNDLAQCIAILGHYDTIAFVDDGCYNMQHPLVKEIDNDNNIQLQVMEKHATARALTVDEHVFTKISMEALVELTFTNDRVITWQ